MNRILLLAAVTVLAGAAQIVEKKALTLDGAKQVIAAAEAEAAKNHIGCNIAVVDDGGNLIAFHRVDPTFPAGARVSIGKARTAALFRQPTKNFEEVITQKGRTSMIALDDFTPLEGGVPIVVAGPNRPRHSRSGCHYRADARNRSHCRGIPLETYRRLDLHIPPSGSRYVVPLHIRHR